MSEAPLVDVRNDKMLRNKTFAVCWLISKAITPYSLNKNRMEWSKHGQNEDGKKNQHNDDMEEKQKPCTRWVEPITSGLFQCVRVILFSFAVCCFFSPLFTFRDFCYICCCWNDFKCLRSTKKKMFFKRKQVKWTTTKIEMFSDFIPFFRTLLIILSFEVVRIFPHKFECKSFAHSLTASYRCCNSIKCMKCWEKKESEIFYKWFAHTLWARAAHHCLSARHTG